MVYHEEALHNYFIPCRRKYSGQYNQCDIRVVHDGKVGCNTVKYTMAFLYSDWLYFLWLPDTPEDRKYGVNRFKSTRKVSISYNTANEQFKSYDVTMTS